MNIEQLIRNNVNVSNTNGVWLNVKCPVCNDYKIRAGFTFTNNTAIVTGHGQAQPGQNVGQRSAFLL